MLYIILTVDHVLKVFDNTPAAKEGTLESGDELVGINDTNVKVIFKSNVDMELLNPELI